MGHLKSLRIVAIVILALLALQFELGMNVNLSPSLKEVPPLAGSVPAIWGALQAVGASAIIHAVLGSLLVLLTIAVLVLSLTSRARSVAVIGILCFVTTALAAFTGVLFTLSGFKDDGLSHGMATNFLLTFALHFVLVCILSVKLRGYFSSASRPRNSP